MKPLDFPLTTSSYRQYQLEEIGADIKDSICRVSDGPFDAEQNANIPTVSYEVRHSLGMVLPHDTLHAHGLMLSI